MIDYDDEIVQDFLSRMDDLDQEVQAGLTLMKSGQLQTGIDAVLRPVHTIKGTAGFIGGLEKLQAAAHQTEDHLRKAQSGQVESTPETVDLLVRAVDVVFEMIEQTRNRPPELDDAEAQKILSRLEGDDDRVPSPTQEAPVFLAHSASDVVKEQAGQGDQVGREEKDGVVILRVKMFRFYWVVFSTTSRPLFRFGRSLGGQKSRHRRRIVLHIGPGCAGVSVTQDTGDGGHVGPPASQGEPHAMTGGVLQGDGFKASPLGRSSPYSPQELPPVVSFLGLGSRVDEHG